jgi:hypothetical protein
VESAMTRAQASAKALVHAIKQLEKEILRIKI